VLVCQFIPGEFTHLPGSAHRDARLLRSHLSTLLRARAQQELSCPEPEPPLYFFKTLLVRALGACVRGGPFVKKGCTGGRVMQEKTKERRFTRAKIKHKIPVKLAGLTGQVTTLGLGGLYIETASPLSKGTVFELQLPLDDNEPPIRARAKVVYVDQGEGMGIEFQKIWGRDAARIGEFLLSNRSAEPLPGTPATSQIGDL
jgi:hypothetical protein